MCSFLFTTSHSYFYNVCVCMRVLSLPTFHTHIQCGHFTVLLVRVEQSKMCRCIVKRMAIHRKSKAINNLLAHINETETKCSFFTETASVCTETVVSALQLNRIKFKMLGLNSCCVCNFLTADLISLKFKDEAGTILDKLQHFIDIKVSIFIWSVIII